jgi:WD40 repeat protein
VCFSPGSYPVGNLARALAEVPGIVPAGPVPPGLDAATEHRLSGVAIEPTLRRSGLGLLDAVRQAHMPAGQSLLVVVDQFEELFRFKQSMDAGGGDAAAFVKLLLEATEQDDVPLYAALTMRSDYLGDCAQFRNLPERLNDAQYLIPRLTRDQRREAITGPVRVGGGRIAPRLVQRLLNDTGDNPDQLPILQHALMRTWDFWVRQGGGHQIDVAHYEAVGAMAEALSRHADEAFEGLSPARQAIAEALFKRLTERDSDNREVRRPARLAELAAVAQAPDEDVAAVIEDFRREGRCLLMPSAGVPLGADTIVDISHESLIRGWVRLKKWVQEETQSAESYRRVADAAARRAAGTGALFRDEDLAQALRWRGEARPNAAWAARYGPEFERAMTFLDHSQQDHLAEVRRKECERSRLRRLAVTLAAALLVAAALGGYAGWLLRREAIDRAEGYWKRVSYARRDSSRLLRIVQFSGLYAQNGDDEARLHTSARTAQLGSQALLAATLPEAGGLDGVQAEITRDAQRLVVWSPAGRFWIWDLADRHLAGVGVHAGKLSGIACSADGRLLLSWGKDGTARLWRTADASPAAPPLHGVGPIRGGAFSGNGSRVVTWSDESAPAAGSPDIFYGAPPPPSRIQVWRTADGSEVPLPGIRRSLHIVGAALDRDGRRLLAWTGGHVELWDVGGTSARRVIVPGGVIAGARFSADGLRFLIWSNAKAAGSAQLWNAVDGSAATAPMRQESELIGASLADDGSRLLTLGADHVARLWTLSPATELPLRLADKVEEAELSGDQRLILTRSADGGARLWDAEDGSPEAELIHLGAIGCARIAGDRRVVTWGSKDGVRWWAVRASDLEVQGPEAPRGPAEVQERTGRPEGSVAQPDGRYLLTWNPRDGAFLRKADGEQVARLSKRPTFGGFFSPKGHFLLTLSGDGAVQLWKVPSGDAAPTIRQDQPVRGAAFSQNDTLLVTWDSDCLRLWNTTDCSPAGPPLRPGGRVVEASISGEGLVAAQTGDGTVQRWNLEADDDFPRQHWPLLVEVATGAEVDPATGIVHGLSPADWEKKRAQYREVAAQHLKTCEHPQANLYLRQERLWAPAPVR